jgi:hypothetical protein
VIVDYRRDHLAAARRVRLGALDPWRAQAAAAMAEARLLAEVERHCRELGLDWYHTWRSDRSNAGYPDLHVVGTASLFRELKTETGRVTDPQQHWLARLAAAGHDVGVWRPSDLLGGRVAAELAAIRRVGARR